MAGRVAYQAEVTALRQVGEKLLAQGKNVEQVARELNARRRLIGEAFKKATPEKLRKLIFARNLERYGDELGPTIEWLQAQGKTWEEIIESASRTGGRDFFP